MRQEVEDIINLIKDYPKLWTTYCMDNVKIVLSNTKFRIEFNKEICEPELYHFDDTDKGQLIILTTKEKINLQRVSWICHANLERMRQDILYEQNIKIVRDSIEKLKSEAENEYEY